MTQLNPTPPLVRPTRPASSNIYTALTFVALAALLFGIIFVWVRGHQLFGTMNPLEVFKPTGV